ncbi:MAG: hypothetical protein UX91_C0003G0088 [Candidatus Amesbacteria bacterium GW2011_GWB1_47_19]|nr:MAG: hypothetical protein UW51_C0003G0094 [Candidatus Amesbacteria bacterium GW2011_GWA1_44_24]KKU31519.1 MAG: hypothetical protein UX46_C0005G0088 [Candidatus Amesbacteria bacterium GW2011_GWC1_46_24]KKU67527.1 MAG: hypothetical protein UX91_C0003G0088 [Candidatus Amesbacteria bacterium GW2011_GWB1_47_19]OGD06208.1 MAG: hypothetical protein A2379_01380 [Candidatus Amesbacteria bacterium RIFOXYB1_FULL_47_13]HBC72539.1 hypothetical protein [Candidatus Amesbacteria bacterium]
MLSDLERLVITEEDRENLLERVGWLEEALYKQGDTGFDMVMKNKIETPLAEIITQEINSRKIIAVIEKINLLLREIKYILMKYKVMRLTIATELPLSIIEDIHRYVYDNVGSGIIFKIDINKDLIAGAVIEYEGKFGDFSKRQKFEKIDWSKL